MKSNTKIMQLALFILQLILIFIAWGGVTNWFRSGTDLISGLFLIMFLILSGILVIPLHVSCLVDRIKKKRTTNKPILIASLLLFIATAVFLKSTTGDFFPLARVAHSIHRTFINHDGEEMQYWVEFKNPFHKSHTEYLVLAKGNEQNRIQIVAKHDDKPFGIGTDTDRILIQESNYLLHTEFEPWIDRFFLIEPNSLNVISNWVVNTKPIKIESNQ